jgi:flagellar biosynthesis protein FliR
MEEFFALLETILRSFEVGQNPQSFLVLVGLAFARLLSFLSIVPFFGGQAVPARVKVATAAAFVIIIYPVLETSVPQGQTLPFGAVGFIGLLIKEALIGFTLGFLASLIFDAIAMAGKIIDIQRGSAMAELFAPQLQARVSEIGQFKLQLAIVLFLAVGAHRVFIEALLWSFEILPPTKLPHLESGWTPMTAMFVTLTGQIFAIGVQLAVPPMIALLLTDLVFGMINRIAPQINVFFLSLPVKMIVGLLVVMLALPLFRYQFIYYFEESYKVFETVLETLSRAYQ